MTIETLKLWDDRDDVELTTFLTLPNPAFPSQTRKPAIIVCPGGAYQTCPRHSEEGDPVAMAFAIDGYQAFVLEYSVETRAPKGKTQFPAQTLDYGKAIMTIREHTLALQKAGIPYELHMFQYGDHGFALGRNLIDAYRTDKSHACAAWLPMAEPCVWAR